MIIQDLENTSGPKSRVFIFFDFAVKVDFFLRATQLQYTQLYRVTEQNAPVWNRPCGAASQTGTAPGASAPSAVPVCSAATMVRLLKWHTDFRLMDFMRF